MQSLRERSAQGLVRVKQRRQRDSTCCLVVMIYKLNVTLKRLQGFEKYRILGNIIQSSTWQPVLVFDVFLSEGRAQLHGSVFLAAHNSCQICLAFERGLSMVLDCLPVNKGSQMAFTYWKLISSWPLKSKMYERSSMLASIFTIRAFLIFLSGFLSAFQRTSLRCSRNSFLNQEQIHP